MPLFPASYIYIYIYFQFIINYFFILVSSLCSAFLYTYIYIYIYYILINVSLIRNRRQELRVADETTIQVPSSCNCNYALQCITLHHYYDWITADHSWRATQYMTTDATFKYLRDAYKRTLLYPNLPESPMVQIAYARTRARACTRVCVCASNSLCMWVSCMCPSALLFAALPANLIELSRYQRNCRNHTVFRGSWLMISQKAGFSFVLALYL